MYCKHCGKKIADDSKYCNFCGGKQDNPFNDTSVQQSSSTTLNTKEDNVKSSSGTTSSYTNKPKTDDSISSTDSTATAQKQPKKKKWVLSVVVILCIVIAAVSVVVGYQCNARNAFTEDINSSDYELFYDDSSGDKVVVTITPKYDFKDFSIEITYYGDGILNSISDKHDIGDAEAGKKITFNKSITDIKEGISGDFEYAYVSVLSSKKRKVSSEDEQEEKYTECDFAFEFHTTPVKSYLYVTITNKTDSYISELRVFSVSIDYEDIDVDFYTPRIKLPKSLAPQETIKVEASGNFTISGGAEEGKKYISSDYTIKEYQVVYTAG